MTLLQHMSRERVVACRRWYHGPRSIKGQEQSAPAASRRKYTHSRMNARWGSLALCNGAKHSVVCASVRLASQGFRARRSKIRERRSM
jgi:hypothetical protein